MQSETKTCQNCKKDFVIEPEDFNFYEKIKVPPPTFCPECRLIRRLAFRFGRTLYKDKCDKCGRDIVSLYHPESPFTVYCSPCWWGDGWNALDYGQEYDFSRSFFEQFYELHKRVPVQASFTRGSVNCSYSNNTVRSKNCMLTFDSFEAVNCYNCQSPALSRDAMDSDIIVNADHVYETVNSNSVYNTKFTYFSDDCLDSYFLFDCKGCQHCFGCVNLRNQKYRIFNKQYSKEEFKEEIKKWDPGSFQVLEEAKKKFEELYCRTPRRFALIVNSADVTGDDIKNTKNCHMCFATRHGVENCKNVYLCGLLLKDSQDVFFGGNISELLYEVQGCDKSQRVFFSSGGNNSSDMEYIINVYNSSHIFGSVRLRNKKYCILNKQYAQEEYETLVSKIKRQMQDVPYVDRKGRIYGYGEFFPTELSSWTYNESHAFHLFPLTKNEMEEKGYNWRDPEDRNYEITLQPENLPDHIKDVTDSILKEVIACVHQGNCNEQCTTAFRILPEELQFHRQMNIALPRICPNCRYYQRIQKRNPPKLWKRRCMCGEGKYENAASHFHGNSGCPEEFSTAISDDRKEIVYCEKCYQAEFI